MRRLLRVLGCASILTIVIGCSTDSDPTTGTTETFAPVALTGSPEETSPPGTDATEVAPAGSVTFSLVTAATGSWPNAVSGEELPIGDIDGEKLCALISDGGAFPSVTGDYYESLMSRVDEQLQFTCKYQREVPAPVPLDRFAEEFVAGLNATDEPQPVDELLSLGLVTFTLPDDPLASVGSDELFRAGRRGCGAAAAAVGLPRRWTLETVANINGNPRVVCRGPVPNPEVVKADTSAVTRVVGGSAPPKR